jgi:hypothetical protein
MTEGRFKLGSNVAKLTFEDTVYAGAEVTVRLDLPMRLFLELERVQADQGAQAALQEMAKQVLLSWNLDDAAGNPIPCDATGILEVPPALAMAIMEGWRDAVSGVPAPLGEQSRSGEMASALNLGDYSRPN